MRAKNRQDITMIFWKENVDKILDLNDKPILQGKGSISNAQMEEMAEKVYLAFNTKRKIEEAKKADDEDLQELKALEQEIKKNKK